MKVFVRKNNTTPTGYEIVTINDDGQEMVQPINDVTKDGISVILPDNPSNRKFYSIKRLQDGLELTYKASKPLGPRTNSESKSPKASISKSDREYLNDDDKVLYDQLMAKIEKAKAIAKAKAIYEAAQREYEELLKAGE